MKRISTETRLTEEEYRRLLKSADPARHPITKNRYCLNYDTQYFEIDVYPFWQDRAILEIEVADEAAEIHFPDQIRVLEEVTGDPSYKNAALAKMEV